jgi:hypothetical protein
MPSCPARKVSRKVLPLQPPPLFPAGDRGPSVRQGVGLPCNRLKQQWVAEGLLKDAAPQAAQQSALHSLAVLVTCLVEQGVATPPAQCGLSLLWLRVRGV